MYGIICMVIFGIVLAACGINVMDNPVKAIILIAFAALGLFVGGLDK